MEHNKEITYKILLDEITKEYQHAHLTDIKSDPLLNYVNTRQPIAFQELFIPIIKEARGRFCCFSNSKVENKTVSFNSGIFSLIHESALFCLEYSLLETLSFIASKVLITEFSLYRAKYQSAFDRLICSNVSTKLYDAFISTMYEGGFTKLLQEYPVMARLFAVVTNQWLNATFELLSRLDSDREEISLTFNSGIDIGYVKDIECGISDRHNGGRTAAILVFDSGLKLVYKPRNLGMEEAWFKLLSYMNTELSNNMFQCVKTINRDSYGWMEFVEHLPCKDEVEIEQYYRRAGALLCMVHILKGTDCHYQNLIACGSYPVLIDLETLFHPYTRELNIGNENYSDEDMEKYYSVLRTGLLPGQAYTQDGKTFDLSGFGAGTGGYPKRLEWVDVNTDNMRQEYVDKEYSLPTNLPFAGGKVFSAKGYVNEIISGFEETYTYVVENKNSFSDAILNYFKKGRHRIILCSTLYYFNALKNSLNTKYMKASTEREEFLSSLYTKSIYINSNASSDIVSKEERNSLNNLDIPYFFAAFNSCSLCTNTKVLINNFLQSSGINSSSNLVDNLVDSGMENQFSFIKIALSGTASIFL